MTLTEPAPDADGVLRVLVYHDMEGLSGQDDWRTFIYGQGDHYRRGRELLTADVNAVVAGLFDGGADEVHIVDAHGSGNPEPDLLLDQLDPRAEMVDRDQAFRPYVDLSDPDVYDAVAVVGMHAKTGSGGFASHTYTLGMEFLANGMSLTETEIIAYAFGRVDVPVIFASGDDKLEADLQTMPWIVYVRTKNATSASTVELRPLNEVHAELRAGAEQALRDRGQARVMKMGTPVMAALRALPPASLEMLDGVPGVGFHDGMVEFQAADFGEAYDGIIALMGVATAGYNSVLMEYLAREHPEVTAGYAPALVTRWLDAESGRWTPPVSPDAESNRSYHGVG
jgi:D-amino peptidase